MPKSSPASRSRQKTRIPNSIVVSRGYPVIFHFTILIILVGLLVFAAFKNMIPLLAGTVFMLLLIIVPRLWSRYALRGISGRVHLSRDRAFPGEEIELEFELDNRGWPLPWLEAVLELPHRLVTGKSASSPYTRKRLRWVTSLGRGQIIKWKHTIEAGCRGDYLLGPLRLNTGDMFGLFPRELLLPDLETLLVYPRITPLNKMEFPMRSLLGEKAAQRSIYEDISRVAGARDYRYDDSFKRIHWKASAARGRLQTRQYESSTSLSLFLVFDVDGFPGEDDDFEKAVSLVASLAYEAERQGFSAGLITNGQPEAEIAIASGYSHLMLVLEALARITPASRLSIDRQMERCRGIVPPGATMAIISRSLSPAVNGLARHLEHDGCSVLCIDTQLLPETEPAVPAEGETAS